MISKIIFNQITFNNLDYKKFDKFISKKGFFVFPAGPALATIKNSNNYFKAMQKADLVFFDSGFFVLLLKIFKNITGGNCGSVNISSINFSCCEN